MERYLISFDDGTMNIPAEDLAAVSDASREVVRAAQAAGAWIFGGGLAAQQAQIVATDRGVTDSTRSPDRGSDLSA